MNDLLELNSKNVDFYFKSGQVAKSVSDMLLILIDMSDEEFLEHQQKKDFPQWAEQILHDSLLVQKIEKITSKRELIQLLKLNMPMRTTPMPLSMAAQRLPSNILVSDFDLEHGQVIKVPSVNNEIEAWEQEFFESTERRLIPREYVKEFVYGTAFGFLTGLVVGGVLYRVK